MIKGRRLRESLGFGIYCDGDDDNNDGVEENVTNRKAHRSTKRPRRGCVGHQPSATEIFYIPLLYVSFAFISKRKLFSRAHHSDRVNDYDIIIIIIITRDIHVCFESTILCGFHSIGFNSTDYVVCFEWSKKYWLNLNASKPVTGSVLYVYTI